MCILGNESSLFGGCKFAMSHQSGPPLTSSDCWQSPPSLSETAFRPRAQFSPGAKLCIACLSATTRAAPAPIICIRTSSDVRRTFHSCSNLRDSLSNALFEANPPPRVPNLRNYLANAPNAPSLTILAAKLLLWKVGTGGVRE